jgi:hypothetical protein
MGMVSWKLAGFMKNGDDVDQTTEDIRIFGITFSP